MAPFEAAQTLAEVEREYILQVLSQCQGNRTHASKLLGISIRGLRLKLLGYSQAGVAVPPRCTGELSTKCRLPEGRADATNNVRNH